MNKFIDELTTTISHSRFPRRIKQGIVNAEISSTQTSVQELNQEITIESKLFVVARMDRRNRENSLYNAASAIRYAIYKDVIELGYKIVDSACEGDCEKVVSLAEKLITKLMGREGRNE